MTLRPGVNLGPYEIVGTLGVGGMGEVYRGRDARLKREVALKVLPEAVAADPDRLARFQREAEVLASLNHPHIAAIYGIEESAGVRALVMELVEGETLAERIARGPIAVDEALAIARQVAEALEAAHEQGVVHRDLKPANIKVRDDGTVKVLDFGLAKLAEPAGRQPPAALSLSPTKTSPALMTGVGILLGTAAYMSPEQAKGRPADRRSDIWAFGAVLYEMLAGRPAFPGDTVADVLSSVLAREPDLGALPRHLRPRIAELVHRCLERDSRQRWQAIGDVRVELEFLARNPEALRLDEMKRPRASWLVPVAATAVIVATITGAAVWLLTRRTPARVSVLAIATGPQAALSLNGADRDIAITPDGSRVIYVGHSASELFVRSLDAAESTSIVKGAPRAPFVSPDGQWVGFVDNANVLKRVAISGGPVLTIAGTGAGCRGATWAADDMIVFGALNPTVGLRRVPAAGGTVEVLTRPDHSRGESYHLWPQALPGGHAVLFTIESTGGPDTSQIAVLDLRTREQKILFRGGSDAHYVKGGYLAYTAGGTLRVVRFDVDRLQVSGTPVPVAAGVVATPNGGVDAAAADDGTLVYVRGGVGTADRELVWVGRNGHETALSTPKRPYIYPRLSPDGSRLAVWSPDQGNDIWIWDMSRLTLTRATFAAEADNHPLWTPDGRRLVFGSERNGARNIFSEAVDGTGNVERLTVSNNVQIPTAVSPDGQKILFFETAQQATTDIFEIEAGGTHRVKALVASPFEDRNGIVSPDGRWLAYEANDSGQAEIYIRPYPDVNSGRWQVSTSGGERPLWSRDGRELFFVSPTGAVMRVGVNVNSGTSWSSTTPAVVVKDGYVTIPPGNPARNYDISPDGQRFLMVKADTSASATLMVVQNWTDELSRLVPKN